MQNQKSLIIGIVVVVLFVVLGSIISRNTDKKTERDPAISTGSNQNIEDSTLTQAQRENIVSTYLQAKINEISPEAPVLGGTFYVTDISFSGDAEGTVSYEDGHIALMADFDYSINEAIIAQGEAAVDLTLSNVREQ